MMYSFPAGRGSGNSTPVGGGSIGGNGGGTLTEYIKANPPSRTPSDVPLLARSGRTRDSAVERRATRATLAGSFDQEPEGEGQLADERERRDHPAEVLPIARRQESTERVGEVARRCEQKQYTERSREKPR